MEKIVGSTITTDTITTMEQPVTLVRKLFLNSLMLIFLCVLSYESTLICLANSEKEKKVVESNTATKVPETPSDLLKAVTILCIKLTNSLI